MTVSNPPTNVPWFENGDPLLQPNTNYLHRLADPYATYDLLVFFTNHNNLINFETWINTIIINNISPQKPFQQFYHPIRAFDYNFQNTDIIAYDRLTPQLYQGAFTYIDKMKGFLDNLYSFPPNVITINFDGTFPDIFAVEEQLSFNLTLNENAIVKLIYYVLDPDGSYGLTTKTLSFKEGEEKTIELPVCCPCSVIVDSESQSAISEVKDAINNVSQFFLFDNIDSFISLITPDPNDFLDFGETDEYQDLINEEVTFTESTVTPTGLQIKSVSDLLGDGVITEQGVFFRQSASSFSNNQLSAPPPQTFIQNPSNLFTPYQQLFDSSFNPSGCFVPNPTGIPANGYGFTDPGNNLNTCRNDLQSCQDASDFFAQENGIPLDEPPPCKPSYQGSFYVVVDRSWCYIRRSTSFTEQIMIENAYTVVEDVQTEDVTTAFLDGVDVENQPPDEKRALIIRTNKSIWQNTVNSGYLLFYAYVRKDDYDDWKNNNPSANIWDIFSPTDVIISVQQLNNYSLNVQQYDDGINESIPGSIFTFNATIPWERESDPQTTDQTMTSCPTRQASRDVQGFTTRQGGVWENEANLQELTQQEAFNIIDGFNWEWTIIDGNYELIRY